MSYSQYQPTNWSAMIKPIIQSTHKNLGLDSREFSKELQRNQSQILSEKSDQDSNLNKSHKDEYKNKRNKSNSVQARINNEEELKGEIENLKKDQVKDKQSEFDQINLRNLQCYSPLVRESDHLSERQKQSSKIDIESEAKVEKEQIDLKDHIKEQMQFMNERINKVEKDNKYLTKELTRLLQKSRSQSLSKDIRSTQFIPQMKDLQEMIQNSVNTSIQSKQQELQIFKDDISQRVLEMNQYSLVKYNKLKQQLIEEIDKFKEIQETKLSAKIPKESLPNIQQEQEIKILKKEVDQFKDMMIQNLDTMLQGEQIKQELYDKLIQQLDQSCQQELMEKRLNCQINMLQNQISNIEDLLKQNKKDKQIIVEDIQAISQHIEQQNYCKIFQDMDNHIHQLKFDVKELYLWKSQVNKLFESIETKASSSQADVSQLEANSMNRASDDTLFLRKSPQSIEQQSARVNNKLSTRNVLTSAKRERKLNIQYELNEQIDFNDQRKLPEISSEFVPYQPTKSILTFEVRQNRFDRSDEFDEYFKFAKNFKRLRDYTFNERILLKKPLSQREQFEMDITQRQFDLEVQRFYSQHRKQVVHQQSLGNQRGKSQTIEVSSSPKPLRVPQYVERDIPLTMSQLNQKKHLQNENEVLPEDLLLRVQQQIHSDRAFQQEQQPSTQTTHKKKGKKILTSSEIRKQSTVSGINTSPDYKQSVRKEYSQIEMSKFTLGSADNNYLLPHTPNFKKE